MKSSDAIPGRADVPFANQPSTATTAAEAATFPWQPTGSKWVVALTVMLPAALPLLNGTIVNVSLPYMQRSFDADVDHISWVLTSYLLSSGVVIPLTGWLAARIGRRRYFLISVAAFMITSALCGAAKTLRAMIVFRFLQGAAGAAMVPTSQAILMEVFPPAEHALAMAVWGIGLMVAPVLGPTLGGWITEHLNWRWNFYINLPAGALAFLMVREFIEDPPYLSKGRAASGRIDYVGILCLTLGLGLLQVVLDRGQRSGWFAALWVKAFTASSLAFLLFLIVHELRVEDPVVDLRVFCNRSFSLAVSLVTIAVFVVFGVNLMNPLFLQLLLGYGPARAGYVVAVRGLGVMMSMMLVGQLSRMGYRTTRLVGLGFAIMAGANWQMARWELHTSLRALMGPIFLSGVGAGMVFPNLSAVALSAVPRERIGFAASLFNMMRNLGSAFGISAATNLLMSRKAAEYRTLLAHARVPSDVSARTALLLQIRQCADLRAFHTVYVTFAIIPLLLIVPLFWLKSDSYSEANREE